MSDTPKILTEEQLNKFYDALIRNGHIVSVNALKSHIQAQRELLEKAKVYLSIEGCDCEPEYQKFCYRCEVLDEINKALG